MRSKIIAPLTLLLVTLGVGVAAQQASARGGQGVGAQGAGGAGH